MDDNPSITVPEMKAKLRRLKDVDLVIVDYLQLMSSSNRIDNRVQEISQITRNMKIMAKELNVPVLTLSQLARDSEKRTNHRPVLSDLRDSGSIEQDADIVMFLYREDYYQDSETPGENGDKNSGECIVPKTATAKPKRYRCIGRANSCALPRRRLSAVNNNILNIENKIERVIVSWNMLPQGSTVIVGLSGGADSMALTHFLLKYGKLRHIHITAAHINHGLRGRKQTRTSALSRIGAGQTEWN